jgi:hypothetical protein
MSDLKFGSHGPEKTSSRRSDEVDARECSGKSDSAQRLGAATAMMTEHKGVNQWREHCSEV